MNETIHGLVLKSADYREYDALVSVLSKEYGKLTFKASGLRKMTSRNAGALLPYTEAEIQFDYRPDKTMFTLKTARTVSLYRHMHEDLQAGTAGAIVGEIADAFSLSGDERTSEKLYPLVQKAFQLVNAGGDTNLILSLYIGDIMRLNGIEPNVDACVIDGNTLVSAISVKEGGFLCQNCARRENERIRNADELHLFRLLVKAGLARYEMLAEKHFSVGWCLKLLEDMLNRQGNVKIRSFMLYNRITDID